MLVRECDLNKYLQHGDHKYITKKMVNGKWRYYYNKNPKDTIDKVASDAKEGLNKFGSDVSNGIDNLFNNGEKSERTKKAEKEYNKSKIENFGKKTLNDVKDFVGEGIAWWHNLFNGSL